MCENITHISLETRFFFKSDILSRLPFIARTKCGFGKNIYPGMWEGANRQGNTRLLKQANFFLSFFFPGGNVSCTHWRLFTFSPKGTCCRLINTNLSMFFLPTTRFFFPPRRYPNDLIEMAGTLFTRKSRQIKKKTKKMKRLGEK